MDALNRTSLVIRIPSEVQAALVDVQNQIRRRAGADLIRWTPASELVFTLVSLGEISIGQIAQLSSTLGPVIAHYPSFDLSLDGVGGSPNNLQPRFLWAGLVAPGGQLDQLNQALERACAPIVPHHEARNLQAHVPIGRLKQESESNRSALGRAIRMAQIGSIGSFRADQVELARMASTSAGPTLVAIQQFPLG